MQERKNILEYAVLSPLVIVLGLALLVTGSYILAGWLMRPVGDDYAWLYEYHSRGVNWVGALQQTLRSENGRYSQNILAAVSYHLVGMDIIRLTAILSVGLFIVALYYALQALQKSGGLRPNSWFSLGGALVIFYLYSMSSITFPWVHGPIDNTFQGFLWLPGFITYTLPLELLIITLAMILLYRDKVCEYRAALPLLVVLGIIFGAFNELITLLYLTLLGVMLLALVFERGFALSAVRDVAIKAKPFFAIAIGLIVGLLVIYTSPASSSRRRLVVQNFTLKDVIFKAVLFTPHYFYRYVLGPTAHDHSALVFILIVGAAFGFLAAIHPKWVDRSKLLNISMRTAAFSLIAMVLSVFLAFVAIFEGYGLGAYLVPRFEVFYTIWLVIMLLALGIYAAQLVAKVINDNSLTLFSASLCIILGLAILADAPHILTQAANRVKTVAVFSQKWDDEDAALTNASGHHAQVALAPVIDIGDSYGMNCNDTSPSNWLGVVKQAYYSIPKLCSGYETPSL